MQITETASPHPGLSFRQFVALVAALMATNALAVDSMLPALGQIGTALGLTDANERQWIVTSYLLGFGAAQLIYGPLTDRFGRRPVLLFALVMYITFSVLAAFAPSFSWMILARVLQGIGSAGTRVLATAIVRDCYEGRTMARVMSLTFLVFLGVPILAPSIGQIIMIFTPWQGIFIALAIYTLFVTQWIFRKLPETLRPENRAPINAAEITAAFRLTLSNRFSLGYTLAMTFVIGGLFGFINTAQQLFADVFHQQKLFPLIFALVAAFIAAASLLNARLVNRIGTRKLSHASLLGYIMIAVIHAAIAWSGHETLVVFAVLQSALMFCFGLMVGNFGAMSMEPLGRIAGTAASIQGFISTVTGALIGILIGQNFNGTALPLTAGFATTGIVALGCVLYAENGRLFQARHSAEES